MRVIILTLACREPRIVDLWAVDLSIEDGIGSADHSEGEWLFKFRSTAERAPSLLHTSQESRAIGLKHYSLAFDMNFTRKQGDKDMKITTPAHIWINFDCDIVYDMSSTSRLSNLNITGLCIFLHQSNPKPIRRLAIDCSQRYLGPFLSNILVLDEFILSPSFGRAKLQDLYDTRVAVNKKLNFDLVPMNKGDMSLRSMDFGMAGFNLKIFAEQVINQMIESEGQFDWNIWMRKPTQWTMPEIRLMFLDIHADGQKCDISEQLLRVRSVGKEIKSNGNIGVADVVLFLALEADHLREVAGLIFNGTNDLRMT